MYKKHREPVMYPAEAKHLAGILDDGVGLLRGARDREFDPVSKGILQGAMILAQVGIVWIDLIEKREAEFGKG